MGAGAQCPGGASSGWPAPVDLSDLLPGQTNGVVTMGLERVKGALNALGNPHNSFAAIQVAGTNGKGSICSLLHGALTAHGLRCGLYTSPHLVSWCERIRVGQGFIAPATLRNLLLELRSLAQQWSLTPFEQLTVAAFLHFHRQAVDLAVLEVGLGGRLDATTAHCRRSTVAFASIGEDHQEYLGADLASIAREKSGVLSPGCVAFSGPQPAAVVAVLRQAAAACGAAITWVPPLPRTSSRPSTFPFAAGCSATTPQWPWQCWSTSAPPCTPWRCSGAGRAWGPCVGPVVYSIASGRANHCCWMGPTTVLPP